MKWKRTTWVKGFFSQNYWSYWLINKNITKIHCLSLRSFNNCFLLNTLHFHPDIFLHDSTRWSFIGKKIFAVPVNQNLFTYQT